MGVGLRTDAAEASALVAIVVDVEIDDHHWRGSETPPYNQRPTAAFHLTDPAACPQFFWRPRRR